MTNLKPPIEPARVLLKDVPKVNFYNGGPRCPEDICFPSCLRAYLEYVGDADFSCKHSPTYRPGCKISCTYSYLVGTSGAGFYLSWKEGWHSDNPAIFYMSADPAAPYQRALESVGYAYEYIARNKEGDNEAELRRRIIASIHDKGRPILADGIIGPPETCLVTGYDEGGEVLIGWNFFQDMPEFNAGVEFEPTGQFRKRDWYQYQPDLGFMFIGEKRANRRKLSDICRDTLQWALEVVRTPMVRPEPWAPEWYRQRHNGLAAYTAWAEHLSRDDAFPTNDEAVLRTHFRVHEDAIGTVAEARWYAGQFLIQMTEHVHYDMIEELLHATACYAGEHELMWRLWDLEGGNGNPQAHLKVADPAVRRAMIPIIHQARDKDAQAADHLERALAKWRS